MICWPATGTMRRETDERLSMIDQLIEACKGSDDGKDLAAILAFVQANGTLRTLGLLVAADRHANAGLLARLRTEGLLDGAVRAIRDGKWAGDDRPWLDRDDEHHAEMAATAERHRLRKLRRRSAKKKG